MNKQTKNHRYIPMEKYEEWRKANRGVRVFFRGPRFLRTPYQVRHGAADCLKEDATHFVVYFNS